MHIELNNKNPLFFAFERKRMAEGYTTTKSAIVKAMQLFIDIPSIDLKHLGETTGQSEKELL